MPARSTSPWLDYSYILGTILLSVYGQLVLKWQMSKAGPLPDGGSAKAAVLVRLLFNPWVMSCIAAGALAMLSWMAALSRFQLTYAYPFMSTTFALVLVLGVLLFGEAVTAPKVIGVALIVLGVAVGSRG